MKKQIEKRFLQKVALSVIVTFVALLFFKFLVDYISLKYYSKKSEDNKIEYMKTVAYYNIVKSQVKFYNDIINISDYIKRNDFLHEEINHYDLALTIVHEAYRKKVDPYLILAVIEVESDFKHNSESIRGAKGLMQVKSETAKYIAIKEDLKVTTKKLNNDPLLNVKLGISYYAYLLNKFEGNHKYALIAYNLGINKVYSLMSQKINLPKSYFYRVYNRYKYIAKLYNQELISLQ